MAAEKGNNYAEGNEGGRPPIYDRSNPEDIEMVKFLSEDYFNYIRGEYEETTEVDENSGKEYKTTKTIRSAEYPTVTGLTLHLGFADKSTLYDYSKIQEFSHSIKRALTRIEQFHEFRAAEGDKCTGNIFVLKNFGWFDTMKTDVTTNGKDLPSSVVINLGEGEPEQE